MLPVGSDTAGHGGLPSCRGGNSVAPPSARCRDSGQSVGRAAQGHVELEPELHEQLLRSLVDGRGAQRDPQRPRP